MQAAQEVAKEAAMEDEEAEWQAEAAAEKGEVAEVVVQEAATEEEKAAEEVAGGAATDEEKATEAGQAAGGRGAVMTSQAATDAVAKVF